jgi:C4-dicarboxylate-specific signal transduction histidine kinase
VQLERPQAIADLTEGDAEPGRAAYASAMTELVAHIAHEVNQPLAAIAANGNACIRWLAADPPNIEEARAAAERTVRDARRASDVIAEMRAFLAQSRGPRSAVSVNALVEGCVAAAAQNARRHEVTLVAETHAEAPRVVACASALRDALDHLIANAIEACMGVSPPMREVRVRVRGPERGEMVIVVEDRGGGFESDSIQTLFEPLYSTKPGRLGLGLAVARSTFESHGGRILAQRSADGVTRFIATLAHEDEVP